MTTSNVERTSSRPFCRWEVEAIVEIRGSCEKSAWGGGCELSLACTLRVAARSAHLGQPEVNVGIIPGAGGTQRLARLVGAGRAAELILSGRIIGAEEAHAIALVEAVLAADHSLDRTLE